MTTTTTTTDCRTKINDLPSRPSQFDHKKYEAFLVKSRLNHIPTSPLERSQILSLVEEATKDLIQCDNRITEAEAMLAQLREQRIQILKRMDQGSLLAPIRKLPVEILSEIFEFALPFRLIRISNATPRVPASRLTKICSFWRQTALSQATLWSDLSLSLRGFHYAPDISHSLLVQCLARSRNMPLRLQIDCPRLPSSDCRHAQTLDALIGRSGQWRDLTMNCDPKTFAHIRSKLGSKLRSCALSKLSINAEEKEEKSREQQHGLLNLLGRGSHLRELHTDSFRVPNQVQTKSLVKLHIDAYVGPPLAVLLAQCPLLEHLALEAASMQYASTTEHPLEFRHNHLSTLKLTPRIRKENNSFSTGMWDHLLLPALTSLSVHKGGNAPTLNNMLPELKIMLVRSLCVLHQVELTDFPADVATDFVQNLSADLLVLDKNATACYRTYRLAHSAQGE